MLWLATLFHLSDGTLQDLMVAFMWFSLAAERGYGAKGDGLPLPAKR